MLQQALNRHPQVVMPPETQFFFSLYRQPLRSQQRHLARLQADPGMPLKLPRQGLYTPAEARTFFAEMAARYAAAVGRPKALYLGEKTPEHTSRPAIQLACWTAKIPAHAWWHEMGTSNFPGVHVDGGRAS